MKIVGDFRFAFECGHARHGARLAIQFAKAILIGKARHGQPRVRFKNSANDVGQSQLKIELQPLYKWTYISRTGAITYDVQAIGPHLVADFIIPKFVSGEIFTVVRTST